MDSGFQFFAAAFFGMFVGTIFLAGYLWVLHRAGSWLGERAAPNRPAIQGAIWIAGLTSPFAGWPFLFDIDPFLKLGLTLATYVLNAFPLVIGYVSARELQARNTQRRWKKNVDDWLGEWECEPAPLSLDDDDVNG